VQTKSGSNPFYPVTALLGVAFVVTTLAYVVAWVRQQPMGGSTVAELGPVLQFFNDRGEYLMIGEAILLAVVAAAAMGLDQWRSRKESSRSDTIR
jgi:hypothetical protein